MDCACKVDIDQIVMDPARNYPKQIYRHIVYCPLHKSAPAMLNGLQAAENHLTALCLMLRNNDLTRWNSEGTVKTLLEIRELIAQAKGK